MTDHVHPSARRRTLVLAGPSLLLAGTLGAATVIALAPESGLLTPCAFARFTGHLCPLCGGVRCVWRLARLDLAGAWHANAFLLTTLPIVTSVWLREAHHRWRTGAAWGGWASLKVPLAGLMVLFWFLRNVPILEPYLRP